MRADYDSEGDTIQIELERVRQLGHGEDVETPDRSVRLDVGARLVA